MENEKQKKLPFTAKEFKQWLDSEVGERCEDYMWNCFVCMSWRLYDDMKAYEEHIEDLDAME